MKTRTFLSYARFLLILRFYLHFICIFPLFICIFSTSLLTSLSVLDGSMLDKEGKKMHEDEVRLLAWRQGYRCRAVQKKTSNSRCLLMNYKENTQCVPWNKSYCSHARLRTKRGGSCKNWICEQKTPTKLETLFSFILLFLAAFSGGERKKTQHAIETNAIKEEVRTDASTSSHALLRRKNTSPPAYRTTNPLPASSHVHLRRKNTGPSTYRTTNPLPFFPTSSSKNEHPYRMRIFSSGIF